MPPHQLGLLPGRMFWTLLEMQKQKKESCTTHISHRNASWAPHSLNASQIFNLLLWSNFRHQEAFREERAQQGTCSNVNRCTKYHPLPLYSLICGERNLGQPGRTAGHLMNTFGVPMVNFAVKLRREISHVKPYPKRPPCTKNKTCGTLVNSKSTENHIPCPMPWLCTPLLLLRQTKVHWFLNLVSGRARHRLRRRTV